MGLSPSRSGGKIFFSMVNFLCWLLFQFLFQPPTPANPMLLQKHLKNPGHSAKGAGGWLQLNTHAPYLGGFALSDQIWCMAEWSTQNTPRQQQFQVAPGMQEPNSSATTPLGWIFKVHCKKATVIHLESHATRARWICLQVENNAIYKSNQQQLLNLSSHLIIPSDFQMFFNLHSCLFTQLLIYMQSFINHTFSSKTLIFSYQVPVHSSTDLYTQGHTRSLTFLSILHMLIIVTCLAVHSPAGIYTSKAVLNNHLSMFIWLHYLFMLKFSS